MREIRKKKSFSVWGEDANEFKLRDLEQYRQVGVPCMFATPMVDKENPENNRDESNITNH